MFFYKCAMIKMVSRLKELPVSRICTFIMYLRNFASLHLFHSFCPEDAHKHSGSFINCVTFFVIRFVTFSFIFMEFIYTFARRLENKYSINKVHVYILCDADTDIILLKINGKKITLYGSTDMNTKTTFD